MKTQHWLLVAGGVAAGWWLSSSTSAAPQAAPKPSGEIPPPAKFSLPHQWRGTLDDATPTLEDVAGMVTGDASRWKEILDANPENKGAFKRGASFRLPIAWSRYIDQNGESDRTGTTYPTCGQVQPDGTHFRCPT